MTAVAERVWAQVWATDLADDPAAGNRVILARGDGVVRVHSAQRVTWNGDPALWIRATYEHGDLCEHWVGVDHQVLRLVEREDG